MHNLHAIYENLYSPDISMIDSTNVLCPENLFEKIAKMQSYYVPQCGHTTFVQSTPSTYYDCHDNSNDANKPSVQLQAINIQRYFVIRK